MGIVKDFSISWEKRNFKLKFICLSPLGKEKVFILYLSPPLLEFLIAKLQKAIEVKKGYRQAEKIDYIG